MIDQSPISQDNSTSTGGDGQHHSEETMHRILAHLERIETRLEDLVQKQTRQDYYSTAAVAEILGRAEVTVREWCRLGRVWAEKRDCGRGAHREWMISHEELERIQNEGLLPISGYRGQIGGNTGSVRAM